MKTDQPSCVVSTFHRNLKERGDALERYGTMSFGEVAAAAIGFAGEGFVMYPFMAELIAAFADNYRRWPSNAAIYLPGGQPPVLRNRFPRCPGRMAASAWYGRSSRRC